MAAEANPAHELTDAEKAAKAAEIHETIAKLTEQHQRLIVPARESALEQQKKTGLAVVTDDGSRAERTNAQIAEMQAEIATQKKALRELEARGQRPGGRQQAAQGAGQAHTLRSVADAFVESEAYRQFVLMSGNRQAIMPAVSVPSVLRTLVAQQRQLELEKRDYDATTVPLGRYFDTGRLIEPRRRVPILRTLIPTYDLLDEHKTKGVEFDEEQGAYFWWSKLTETANQGATTLKLANVRRLSAYTGFKTLTVAAADYTIVSVDVINNDGSGEITVTPGLAAQALINAVVKASGPMWFGAEGQAGSQYQDDYVIKQFPAAAIRADAQTTLERMAVRSWVERKLMTEFPRKMGREEEHLSLYAPAVGGKPVGLMNDTRIALTTRASLAPGSRVMDTVLTAISECEKRDYDPDAALIPPDYFLEMATDKGADRQYVMLLLMIQGELALWQVPILKARALTGADGLVGEFAYSAELWVNQDAEAYIGTVGEQLRYGMRTMVMTEWMALPITHPNGFQRMDLTAS